MTTTQCGFAGCKKPATIITKSFTDANPEPQNVLPCCAEHEPKWATPDVKKNGELLQQLPLILGGGWCRWTIEPAGETL